jgi:hypothetical protein
MFVFPGSEEPKNRCVCNHNPYPFKKTEYDIFSRIVKEQPTRSTGNDGQGRFVQTRLSIFPAKPTDAGEQVSARRTSRGVTSLAQPWSGARQSGGGERDRTDDPLLAKQVLSQLSYTPVISGGGSGWTRTNDPRLIKTVL